MIYDDDGKKVYFGQTGFLDFILHKIVNPEIADTRRKVFLARSRNIKGDWKKNKFSPNNLAIKILWSG